MNRMKEPFHSMIWEASKGYNDSWSQVDPEVLQRFAESIVFACARQASGFSIDKNPIHPDISYDEMSDSARMVCHMTAQRISEHLLEHFGLVEVD